MLDVVRRYINDQYGSRRGLLNLYKFYLQYYLGAFDRAKAINWSAIDRFIFICHGNICRSPLAEAVARQHFNLNALSYGLDCTEGAGADSRALAFAKSLDIDLNNHRARHIDGYQPQKGDLIIGMEPAHLYKLSHLISGSGDMSATLIGLWGRRPKPYVHDPYSANEKYFNACERFIINGVEGVAERWSAAKR
jgi:protein-tyrosine phosphatase